MMKGNLLAAKEASIFGRGRPGFGKLKGRLAAVVGDIGFVSRKPPVGKKSYLYLLYAVGKRIACGELRSFVRLMLTPLKNK